MPAGYFTKTLSTLLSSLSRWVEFADGTQAPVHGAVQIDPATGLPLDVGAPVDVTSSTLATAAQLGSLLTKFPYKTNPFTLEPDSVVAGTTLSAAGNATIVAGAANTTIKIYSLRIECAGANVIQLRSATTVLHTIEFTAAGVFDLPFSWMPHYFCGTASAFNITTSTTAKVNWRARAIRD